MEYISIEEARKAPGLRLVLTGGLPAPWSESAKGLFRVRKVDYLPVLQQERREMMHLHRRRSFPSRYWWLSSRTTMATTWRGNPVNVM